MFRFTLFILVTFIACQGTMSSQPLYQFTITATKDICEKATAALEISGTEPSDTISILWSNGQANSRQIQELVTGNYSVNIKIKHKHDTLVFIKDTTLYFSVEKELCGVSIDKYFSPNGDNYHDKMEAGNFEYYPNFEFTIFNKWGQQVHSQKHSYTPWDGKWNGI